MSGTDEFLLAAGEIHVWAFGLDWTRSVADQAWAGLAEDERRRADAYHFERDRTRFVAARARLRELLAAYAGCAPREIRLMTGPYGKPALAPAGAGAGLEFNLSHAQDQALLAVRRGGPVGVDLEQVRADVDAAGIVASHFSQAERAAWAALPEAERRAGFFRGWVRKEAYAKARGEGLSRAPERYTVTLAAGAAALLADEADAGASTDWSLEDLSAPAGFVAALAYVGPVRTLRRFAC